MSTLFRFVGFVGMFIFIAACGNQVSFKPDYVEQAGNGSGTGEFFYPMKVTTEYFKQIKYDKNNVSIVFQAFDRLGFSVKGLKESDFSLQENGVQVKNFSLLGSAKPVGRVADIIFVLDVTASMQPYINSVKSNVAKFVRDLSNMKIKANLCLVTFSDNLEGQCNSFVEDDPSTKENENLDDFLKKVDKLAAGGGGDFPENQLLALEAASRSPWHVDAQRMAILLTDDEFHYAPDYLGHAPSAPTYDHAFQTILDAQMQVFAVAPDVPGYRTPFKGQPSLTEGSMGQWYNFSDLGSGKKDLSDIFNAIIDQVKMTYLITYEIDANPGLDPSLVLSDRVIQLADSNLTRKLKIKVAAISSTQPAGRPAYPRKFKLKEHPYTKDLKLMVGSSLIDKGFSIDDDELIFDVPPSPDDEIRAYYFKKSLRENFEDIPDIPVPAPVDGLLNLKVYINGHLASRTVWSWVPQANNHSKISIRSEAFDDSDHFGMRDNQGLRLKFVLEKQ